MAQDPLFVRRHELFRDSTHHKVYWPPTERRSYNQEAGSFLEGVLFQLGPMAGKLGLTQVESDKSFSGHNTMEAVAATQIASLRSLAWARLNQSDLHAAGVKLRLAREVVAVASLKPAMANGGGRTHHRTDRPGSPNAIAQVFDRARRRGSFEVAEFLRPLLPGRTLLAKTRKQATRRESTDRCPAVAGTGHSPGTHSRPSAEFIRAPMGVSTITCYR